MHRSALNSRSVATAEQSGRTLIFSNPAIRARALQLIEIAPHAALLNIKEAARTNDAKLWAMLSGMARAKLQGRVFSTEAWKAFFMNAASFTCTFHPPLDGQHMTPLGFKWSRLDKAGFSDAAEATHYFAAENGTEFIDPIGSIAV